MPTRTYAAALLLVGFVLAYADRLAINVLLPAIKGSFGLTLVEASLLAGFAFSLFFAIAGLPLGALVDRANRRNLLALGIATWSLATIACGLSNSFWQLFAARILVGVGEACLAPASASMLADLYPPEKRGRAISFTQAGVPVGSLLATMGVGWLLTWLNATQPLSGSGLALQNWQLIFVLLGSPGLLLALLLLGVKEPARRETSAQAGRPASDSATAFFRDHAAGLSAFALLYAAASMAVYAALAWTPMLLMTAYGLSAGAAGTILGAMLFFCSVSAYFLSGVWSDALIRIRPRNGRVFMPGLVLPAGIAGVVWLYFASGLGAVTAAIALCIFVGTFVAAGMTPAVQAITPNRLRGRSIALLYLVVNLLGLGVAPTLVAVLAEQGLAGPRALQASLATVCLGALVAAMLLWPVVLRAYARMRNYELEDMAPSLAAPAPIQADVAAAQPAEPAV